VLYEPANAPGLKAKAFITLQPTVAATTSAKSFDLNNTQTNTQTKGDPIMSNVQTPALALSRPLTEADAKYCSSVMAASLQLAPKMYQAMNSKDFQSNGTEPIADGKFWGLAIGAAMSAIPAVVNAVSGKDFQTTSTEPVDEEKFWTQVISAAVGAVPGIIDAVSGKDFQVEGSLPQVPSNAPGATPPIVAPAVVENADYRSGSGWTITCPLFIASGQVSRRDL
jgi:hypothetical protein